MGLLKKAEEREPDAFPALAGRETRDPCEPGKIQQPGLKKTGLPWDK